MVIPDEDAEARAAEIRRVIFCSGKVYVDLMSAEQPRRGRTSPSAASSCSIRRRCGIYAPSLDAYPHAEEIVWVQEEPENMGAWDFIRPHLQEVADGRPVRRVARPRSASPAEGSASRHAHNQQVLVDQAYGGPVRPEALRRGRAEPALRGMVKA